MCNLEFNVKFNRRMWLLLKKVWMYVSTLMWMIGCTTDVHINLHIYITKYILVFDM